METHAPDRPREAPPERQRALVVWNRRSTRAPDDPSEIAKRLGEHFDVTLEVVGDPATLGARVRSRLGDRFDVVVAAGGDGTVATVAGLLADTGSRARLGIVPLGNANDFARTVGIAPPLANACAAITHGEPRPVDLGRADGRPFLNAANVGVAARVAAGLEPGSKRRFGMLAYLPRLWRALRRQRRFGVHVTCDGRRSRHAALHVAVANGGRHGGGFVVSEDASPDGGTLIVSVVPAEPWWRLLSWLPALRRGRRREQGMVERRGREIRVETRPDGLPVTADGERIARTPVVFRVEPGALRVMAPAHAQDDREPLRHESAVALNACVEALLHVAEGHTHAARLASREEDVALLDRLARERREGARELAPFVRVSGELPAEPDPDREAVERAVRWARTRPLPGGDHRLMADRRRAERRLARRIAEALDAGLPSGAEERLRRLLTTVRAGRERLERR